MVYADMRKDAKILLVEDSIADQRLIARAVRDTALEAELFTVDDGEQAMAYLQRRGRYQDPASSPRPDIVLLDINMPKKDGKQVLREIRDDDSLHNLPVIMLTTSNQERDIIDSYNLGVNAYITKPTELASFIDTVQTLELFWFKLAELPGS